MLGKNINGSTNWNEVQDMKEEQWTREEEIEYIDNLIYQEQECELAIALWLKGDFSPEQAGFIYTWIGTPTWRELTEPCKIDHPDWIDEF